jgi:hypothetical protein
VDVVVLRWGVLGEVEALEWVVGVGVGGCGVVKAGMGDAPWWSVVVVGGYSDDIGKVAW